MSNGLRCSSFTETHERATRVAAAFEFTDEMPKDATGEILEEDLREARQINLI